jgi:glycosyltransferase involved in cell wall biosynthesis
MYASELTKKLAGGYPGFVQPSLIDIDTFVPPSSKPSDSSAAGGAFTVGRLSRANPKKHHADDPELYRRLVENGCRIRIMGPSPSLEAQLGGSESVELLPMFAQEAHLFLQGLDCFFYRTSEGWSEPSGRVVTEAMACGLPVVCHESGGYAEIIEHGRNGFLFDTQQEALEILLRLKEDRGCASRWARRQGGRPKGCSLLRYALRSSSSTCVDRRRGRPQQLREQQGEGMVAKILKRVVPARLRPPVRGAVLFLIPFLQRQLKRVERRRNRLERHIRRLPDRLSAYGSEG